MSKKTLTASEYSLKLYQEEWLNPESDGYLGEQPDRELTGECALDMTWPAVRALPKNQKLLFFRQLRATGIDLINNRGARTLGEELKNFAARVSGAAEGPYSAQDIIEVFLTPGGAFYIDPAKLPVTTLMAMRIDLISRMIEKVPDTDQDRGQLKIVLAPYLSLLETTSQYPEHLLFALERLRVAANSL